MATGETGNQIDKLEIGDYVNYPTANGEKIKCQVLYDKKYNEEHETNYGVQLVALSRSD